MMYRTMGWLDAFYIKKHGMILEKILFGARNIRQHVSHKHGKTSVANKFSEQKARCIICNITTFHSFEK